MLRDLNELIIEASDNGVFTNTMPDCDFSRMPDGWTCCFNPNGDEPICAYQGESPLAAFLSALNAWWERGGNA